MAIHGAELQRAVLFPGVDAHTSALLSGWNSAQQGRFNDVFYFALRLKLWDRNAVKNVVIKLNDK